MFSSFNLNLYEMETLNGPWLKKISQGSSCSELVDASSFKVRLHGALSTSSICRGPCSLQRSWLRWSLRPKQLLNSHLLKSSLSPFLKVFPSLLPSSTLHLPAMSLAAGCSVVFLTCSALCSHECPSSCRSSTGFYSQVCWCILLALILHTVITFFWKKSPPWVYHCTPL